MSFLNTHPNIAPKEPPPKTMGDPWTDAQILSTLAAAEGQMLADMMTPVHRNTAALDELDIRLTPPDDPMAGPNSAPSSQPTSQPHPDDHVLTAWSTAVARENAVHNSGSAQSAPHSSAPSSDSRDVRTPASSNPSPASSLLHASSPVSSDADSLHRNPTPVPSPPAAPPAPSSRKRTHDSLSTSPTRPLDAVSAAKRRAEVFALEQVAESKSQKRAKAGGGGGGGGGAEQGSPDDDSADDPGTRGSASDKYQRRLQKNRDSAFVSRIRRRAYTQFLEEGLEAEERARVEAEGSVERMRRELEAMRAERNVLATAVEASKPGSPMQAFVKPMLQFVRSTMGPVAGVAPQVGVTSMFMLVFLIGALVPGMMDLSGEGLGRTGVAGGGGLGGGEFAAEVAKAVKMAEAMQHGGRDRNGELDPGRIWGVLESMPDTARVPGPALQSSAGTCGDGEEGADCHGDNAARIKGPSRLLVEHARQARRFRTVDEEVAPPAHRAAKS